MEHTFSSRERLSYRNAMTHATDLDLLIIGGGITGAGILLDAVTRGMRAAVIEMQDFAAGTSSRSTKLVHGGLRYLKQFEIRIVSEVGKERAVVYENAPHVTHPQWMLLPIIQGGTYGRLSTSVGLTVYDKLAGVKHSERRRMLSREEALLMEPLLRTDGLKGGGYYVEYRTDDARLTIETLKKAVELGGVALNYTKAEKLLYDENRRLVGIEMRDVLTDEMFSVHAKRIVNATGPWVDELREQDGSKQGKYIHWTKGVHIVIDGKRFPMQQSVYFDTPDKRMVFAIPRAGKTYVGTTDTNYTADIMHPQMTEEDLNYLVNAVNDMFPDVKLTTDDVESSWAGVRPLIHEEGKSPSEISRKDEIFVSDSGLITIAGGKLTGYRKMAERVVDHVSQDLQQAFGMSLKPCQTKHLPLSGGDFGGSQYYEPFIDTQVQRASALNLSEEVVRELAERYGTNVNEVFTILQGDAVKDWPENLPDYVRASLLYSIDAEACTLPEDFLIRRSSALFFDVDFVKTYQVYIVAAMQRLLGWSDEETAKYAQDAADRLREATEPQRTSVTQAS